LSRITFKFDVFIFNQNTSELSNYFRPTQNSEEPLIVRMAGKEIDDSTK
jgi:hypothetical protein